MPQRQTSTSSIAVKSARKFLQQLNEEWAAEAVAAVGLEQGRLAIKHLDKARSALGLNADRVEKLVAALRVAVADVGE